MASKNGARTAYRSAISGKFVTAAQAKRSPNTTVKEKNPPPSKPRKR